MKLILCSCIVSVFMLACKAQQNPASLKKQNNSNTLLWQVTGKGLSKPSYLFGTFHLLCKEDINFSEQLRASFKSANEIYMEMDMDDPSTLLGGLMFLNMKGEKKLKDLYTAEEFKRVESYFNDTLHMPFMMFQKAKPYFLVALLYPQMMNCKTAAGVEEELVKLAKENKKEIRGLETMEFQASVFDSIPYAWQAKELLKNIDNAEMYKKEFDTMVNIYKDQQLDAMVKLFTKNEFGDGAYEDILLLKRNKNWVGQLNTIMKKESVFVAVGAGHLVGEKGLISLLKKEGYTVEPLVNK